jgi:hypothetical protein
MSVYESRAGIREPGTGSMQLYNLPDSTITASNFKIIAYGILIFNIIIYMINTFYPCRDAGGD